MTHKIENILSEVVARKYRHLLRGRILEERGRCPLPGTTEMECGLCWTWDNPKEMEQHEALVPRGWVMGRKGEERDVAFHPCNVVLRHKFCPPVRIGWNRIDEQNPQPIIHQFRHEGGTGGELAFRRCAIHLVRYETFERVHAYLKAVYSDVPAHAGNAFDRFMALEGDEVFEAARRYALKGIEEDV